MCEKPAAYRESGIAKHSYRRRALRRAAPARRRSRAAEWAAAGARRGARRCARGARGGRRAALGTCTCQRRRASGARSAGSSRRRSARAAPRGRRASRSPGRRRSADCVRSRTTTAPAVPALDCSTDACGGLSTPITRASTCVAHRLHRVHLSRSKQLRVVSSSLRRTHTLALRAP